jgi:hypothetical protein
MEKKLAETIKMAEMQRRIQREKLDLVRKNNEFNLEKQRKVIKQIFALSFNKLYHSVALGLRKQAA